MSNVLKSLGKWAIRHLRGVFLSLIIAFQGAGCASECQRIETNPPRCFQSDSLSSPNRNPPDRNAFPDAMQYSQKQGRPQTVNYEPAGDSFLTPGKSKAREENSQIDQETKKLPEMPTPKKALSLDQVINLCLIADPKLRSGFELIIQANAAYLTASLPPNPQLYGDLQLLPLTKAFTPILQGGPPQMDFQVTYPIDWFVFGKRAAAMVSAAHGIRISEADYANLIRQKVTEASLAYYDILESLALMKLAERDLESFRMLEMSSRKAAEGGGRPSVELNRIRLDLLKSEQNWREAQRDYELARGKLASLLGQSEGDFSLILQDNLTEPLKGELPSLQEAMQMAEENRPDLKALRLQIVKAEADVTIQERGIYPDLSPLFGYTRQFQSSIGFPDANSWMVAVSTSLPIFNRNQGNLAKAQSMLRQSTYELQAGMIGIKSEIHKAVVELTTAYRNVAYFNLDQLKMATEVRDYTIKAYQAGKMSLIEALDAQDHYRDTYQLYITGRAKYWRALMRFQGAVGTQIGK